MTQATIEYLRTMWLLASKWERFILAVLPFTTTWDLMRGNWLDLVVGCIAFTVIKKSVDDRI